MAAPLSPSLSLARYAMQAARRPASYVTATGAYNKPAIMREAIRRARIFKASSWQESMRLGLLSAWKAARAEMAEAVRIARATVIPAELPAQRLRSVPRPSRPTFISGSRVNSHGW